MWLKFVQLRCENVIENGGNNGMLVTTLTFLSNKRQTNDPLLIQTRWTNTDLDFSAL